MKRRWLWGVVMLLLCAMPVSGQDSDAGYRAALRQIELVRTSGATELNLVGMSLVALPLEVTQMTNLRSLNLMYNNLTSLPPEIGQLENLQSLTLNYNQLTTLPPEIGQLKNLRTLTLSQNQLTELPTSIGQLTGLEILEVTYNPMVMPPIDTQAQGTQAILAYLRDYEAMLMRQTIAGIAAGVGGIAALILAFRWRQRRGLSEKKKRA